MGIIAPQRYVTSIDVVDLDDLKRCGVRGLLLDRDNTVIPRTTGVAPREVEAGPPRAGTAGRSAPPSWTASQSAGIAGATQRTDRPASTSPSPHSSAAAPPRPRPRPCSGAGVRRSPHPSTAPTSLHLHIPPAGTAPQVLSPTLTRCRQDLSICRPRSVLCGPRQVGTES